LIHGGLSRIAELPEEQVRDRSRVIVRLLRYTRPYRWAILAAFAFILVSAAAQAGGPYLIGRAIDDFITLGNASGLARTMLALIGIYLAGMLGMRFQIYLMSWVGQRVLADLRTQVMGRIHVLSLRHIEKRLAGDLQSRLVNDVEAINSFFSQGLTQSLGALFALAGIVIAMFLLNWQLALAALAIVPVMVLTTGHFSRLARRAFRRTRSTIGDVSADIQEDLTSVKVAQAYNRSELNMRRFIEKNAANRDANVSANAVTSAFTPAMDVLSTIDTAIVAGYGGFLALQGVVSVGIVVAFLQYVQNFFRPIQTVAQTWTLAQSAFAASERIFELLDAEVEIKDAPHAIELASMDGEVTFEGVGFAYEPDQPVLVDIDMHVEPGKTIAIVGPTGAGKSTLVSLIMRLYEPTQGRIMIDGHDIRDIRQQSLRAHMGVVTQDSFLFSGSVMENIRYGALEASDEEVVAVAKTANAHDFISRLPQGYETEVGERGGLLSIGQRQLVCIARAILASPPILILDEATASVDTRTEAAIQQALAELLQGRTSFVIAHRLSTVHNADLVLVLDQGRIVQRGTHAQLLGWGGLYAELYNRQFKLDEYQEEQKQTTAEWRV
jgi:ATP-binding cassette, subfamily B, multidrug efflux pump